MQVTITEEHLDRAIKAKNDAISGICENCLISQAISEAIKESVSTGIFINEGFARKLTETPSQASFYFTDFGAQNLMHEFDSNAYVHIRAKLPYTFILHRRKENVNG